MRPARQRAPNETLVYYAAQHLSKQGLLQFTLRKPGPQSSQSLIIDIDEGLGEYLNLPAKTQFVKSDRMLRRVTHGLARKHPLRHTPRYPAEVVIEIPTRLRPLHCRPMNRFIRITITVFTRPATSPIGHRVAEGHGQDS